MNTKGSIRKVIAAILFSIYFLYLIYLTFFSHLYGRGFIHRNINLVPFRTIIEYATASYNRRIIVTNLLGNILAFAPMGFLIPWIWKRFTRLINIVLLVTVVSVGIEVAQYIFGVGAADVDDVILNVAGGGLGFGFYKAITMLCKTT